MSLATVNNLYENGVCDEFTIYTGTTYNGDPYIIPVSAQSIGSHSLPHTFDVGGYEGPLYIFLVHCDFYVTPPPSETPKRQGGFQVKLINIDCENCPPFSPVATPIPTPSPSPTPTTDCNFTVNFVEYSPAPSPTPSPSPSPTPTPTDEVACQCFEINSNRQGYFSYSYVDCSGVTVNATSDTPPMEEITFHVCAQSIISVAEKVTYSVYGTCTDGVCDNTPAPSPTQSPTPTPTPTPTPNSTPTSNCDNYSLVPHMGETTASYRWKECGSNEFSNWTGVSGDQLDVCAESGTVSKVSGNGDIFIGNECYPDPLSYNMSNSTNSNGNACEQINTYPIQVFSEGNGFQLNSIVHQTVQLNNPFVGDNTYYKLNKNGGIILQISGSGEITERVNCVLD